MIDVKEILKKHHCTLDTIFPTKMDNISSAIKEIITEVLKEAADSAKINHVSNKGFIPCIFNVNKESITSVINKVKF